MTRMNDLSNIIWMGRQWAVTDHGLETIREPYHYHLSAKQLAQLGQGSRSNQLESMIHVMEKNWLDVDDFITAYLVALSAHGINVSSDVVRDSLRAAMRERADLYEPKPGQVPAPKGSAVRTLSDLDKYMPEPPWHGSQVLGVAVGGRVEQPPKKAQEE